MGAQLEKARLRAEQLKRRIRDLEAAEKKKERSADRRKSIIKGRFLDHWMEIDPKAREYFDRHFPGYLNRDVDRELFGYDPVSKGSNAELPAEKTVA